MVVYFQTLQNKLKNKVLKLSDQKKNKKWYKLFHIKFKIRTQTFETHHPASVRRVYGYKMASWLMQVRSVPSSVTVQLWWHDDVCVQYYIWDVVVMLFSRVTRTDGET